jgi:hypothetical protein
LFGWRAGRCSTQPVLRHASHHQHAYAKNKMLD